MKIINIKFNFKLLVITLFLIIFILSAIFLIQTFKTSYIVMNDENYTSILKEVHDNIDNYIDKKIISTGYIFRASDFNNTQFVVARDMLISENDYKIVGFLCEFNEIDNYENNIWVEISGTIKLKDYHGPMPVIEVTNIKRITTPNETFVYPPKN